MRRHLRLTKKNLLVRQCLEVALHCERAIAWSRRASAAFAHGIVPVVPAKLNERRGRLGALVFLTALGLTLSGIVMRTAPMAAPVDVAPTWGKVLIAGGLGAGLNDLSSTELYDPATNSFAAGPAMNSGRGAATATLLPSGKVLIAGGGILSSTDLYDPATNSFAAGPVMSTARNCATATLLPSGKVLIAGGADGSKALSSTDLYDPATNSFAAAGHTAAMNTARDHATATLLASGKVLIAGGRRPDDVLASTELYDPVTNSFASATAAMNTPRFGATATLLPSGKVLIAGGLSNPNPSSDALSSTELYDPATNTSAGATAAMNTGRFLAVAILLPLTPSPTPP